MQDRVLDAADVEIDAARLLTAHPKTFRFFADEAPAVLRVAKSQVIPAGAGPLWHRVRLACRVFGITNPIFRFRERWFARAGWLEILERGRLQRKFRFRKRLMFSIAPDYWEWFAPIALPREKPV